MSALTHYIVVRRDLALGDALAQTAHAAGESFFKLTIRPGSSETGERSRREADGSNPSRGSTFNPSHTIVVVLGARNESKLLRLEQSLLAAGVAHAAIRETDGDYAGQLMAIGLVPAWKEAVAKHVREFHMLHGLAGQPA